MESGKRNRRSGRLPHDQAWKLLLARPEMIAPLLTGLVRREVLDALDLSGLDRRSGEYVAEGRRAIRGDIVWFVPWRRRPGGLFVPVEIQSRPDPEMPSRMAGYSLHASQAAGRGILAPGEGAAVFAILLHTGATPWRPPEERADTVRLDGLDAASAAWLRRRQVRQRICYLSIRHMAEAAIRRIGGVPARIFRLIRAEDVATARIRCMAAARLPEIRDSEGMQDAFRKFVWNIILPQQEVTDELEKAATFEEWIGMTQEVFAAWEARSAEKGERRGEKRGEERGLKRGEERGLKKGRAERSLEIALNLLRLNAAVDMVVEATGLSQARVRKLAREIAEAGNPAGSPA